MPYGYYYGFDSTWFMLVLPAFLLAMWAQFKVTSTYNKYAQVRSVRGRTAAEIARQILDSHGLTYVRIEQVAGNLTDHYDPKTNVVRLSQGNYNSTSIAAIGVAAHEVGHAVQHAEEYGPLKLRTAIIPMTNIGSQLAIPIFLLGLVMNFSTLTTVGILLFSLTAVFQLVTLPVEFNASRRALTVMDERAILTDDELRGARKVLSAAALTYVAALAQSLAQLLRLVTLSRNNRRR